VFLIYLSHFKISLNIPQITVSIPNIWTWKSLWFSNWYYCLWYFKNYSI